MGDRRTTVSMVADLLPGDAGSAPSAMASIGDRLWFTASDGVHGREVWTIEERSASPPLVEPPVPPRPVDRTVSVAVSGRQVKLDRRGGGLVQVRCPASEVNGPCRGELVLRTQARLRVRGKRKARQVVLARARFSVAAGKTASVRLRLGAAARRLVASNRRARRAQVVVTVRDGVGNRATVRKALRVVPART